MTYREVLSNTVVAISVSESPDMSMLGLSKEHLRDAMAEIARHLLALGARLVYGGDVRKNGFGELLIEIVARHQRDANDQAPAVIDYLAWPVHISGSVHDIEASVDNLEGCAKIILLDEVGQDLTLQHRQTLTSHQPSVSAWHTGLSAMRRRVANEADARIILGGRTTDFKGVMPGVAEEALLTLERAKPLYVLGGYGGCAHDIGVKLGITDAVVPSRSWSGGSSFSAYSRSHLYNGLAADENATLAKTPHVDQAVALVLRGLTRSFALNP